MAMRNYAGIDRVMILDQALAMADDGGLESVTMRALAIRLDVAPMTIYRHFRDRHTLIDELAESLLVEVTRTAYQAEGADYLHRLLQATRDTARRHPLVFPRLLFPHRATSASTTAQNELYRALIDRGVDFGKADFVMSFINAAVVGWAAAEASGLHLFSSEDEADRGFDLVEEVIDRLIDARQRRLPAAPSSAKVPT
jgi:AcrR family transcriptional regulator